MPIISATCCQTAPWRLFQVAAKGDGPVAVGCPIPGSDSTALWNGVLAGSLSASGAIPPMPKRRDGLSVEAASASLSNLKSMIGTKGETPPPAALPRRNLRTHFSETVALFTSLPPQSLSAAPWRQFNRAVWSIENGLCQTLDVWHRDDLCRNLKSQSMRVMGMFRRFSNSLFMHWCSRKKKSRHKATTDFFSATNAEHHCHAIRCIHVRRRGLQTASWIRSGRDQR